MVVEDVARKLEVLRDLSLGARIAEDETDQLASYFVETDQWRLIIRGEVDVVYGAKGAGKSAIYSMLLARKDQLFDRSVLVESAEEPRGEPVFAGLTADPPTSQREFVGLWKTYILTLTLEVLDEYEIKNGPAREMRHALEGAGFVRLKSRWGMVKQARDFVRRMLAAEAVEPTISIDPSTGAPIGASLKITLGEPDPAQAGQGYMSLGALLSLANKALSTAGFSIWILLDRLDVAFADSRELEKNALRALFLVYRDLAQQDAITLKIFMRSDIWRAITDEGFREASHITRELTLEWSEASLRNLVVRRLVQNEALRDYYGLAHEDVLASVDAQMELLSKIFPDQVELGSRRPKSFQWMLSHTRDGSGKNAPRELIHLLTRARAVQCEEIERGEDAPDGERMFTGSALKAAWPDVSKQRLEKTIYGEYPELKRYIEMLEGAKATQTLDSLAAIWGVPPERTRELAKELTQIGFFDEAKVRSGRYWVPFLYRPALQLVQGAPEGTEDADMDDA